MRIIALITLLLTAQVAAAKILFMPFGMPYFIVSYWYFAIAMGLIEIFMIWYLRNELKIWIACLLVISCSILSWCVGVAIVRNFPSWIMRYEITTYMIVLTCLGWALAFTISTAVEGACLWLVNRFISHVKINQPFLLSLQINGASFGTVAVIALLILIYN